MRVHLQTCKNHCILQYPTSKVTHREDGKKKTEKEDGQVEVKKTKTEKLQLHSSSSAGTVLL